jgi:predicted PurR-regulated permease PerM
MEAADERPDDGRAMRRLWQQLRRAAPVVPAAPAPEDEVPAPPPRARVHKGNGMPRWLPRAFVLAGFTVVVFVVGWWIIGQLQSLLVLLLVAQFLAFALEPAVNWLAARGWRRGAATGAVMLGVTLVIGGMLFAIGSILVGEVANLITKAPVYAQGVVDWINRTFNADISAAAIQRRLTDPNGPLGGAAAGMAQNAFGIGTALLGALFQFFTVLLFAYYLCADGPRIRRGVLSLLPPVRQREVLRAWELAIEKTGGYIYSRLLLALASGFAHYVVLQILGVPYALALALWIGLVSQLVPTVGTYLAAILPLAIAVVTDPQDALWLLIFIVIYQQIENYLLQPRITAHTLDMHPAVAFGAVIAGAAVLGAVGALLAIPFVAIVQSFISTYIRRYAVEDHPLTELESEEAETGDELEQASPT